MLVFLLARLLIVKSILLCLKLFQKFTVILGIVLLLGSVAIYTVSSTIILAFLILSLLLLICRIKVFNSDVFLLLGIDFVTSVHDIDCFVNVLFLFILEFTDIQLIHC